MDDNLDIFSLPEVSLEPSNDNSKDISKEDSDNKHRKKGKKIEDYGNLVKYDSIEELLEALKTTYTLSFRDICKIFKCERPWVNSYIKPRIHYVYLSNGFSGDFIDPLMEKPKQKFDFLKRLTEKISYENSLKYADVLQRLEKNKDALWFNEKELYNLLFKSSKDGFRASRKSIRIPIEYLMYPSKVDDFRKAYDDSIEDTKEKFKGQYGVDIETIYTKALRNIEDIDQYLSPWGEYAFSNLPSSHIRGKLKECSVNLPSISPKKFLYNLSSDSYSNEEIERLSQEYFLKKLYAIHDKLDYGDTTESHYRKLFRAGSYKLTLELTNCAPKEEIKMSQKVYYLIPDETSEGIGNDKFNGKYNLDNTIRSILVSYEIYEQWILGRLGEYK